MSEQDWNEKCRWMRDAGATAATFDPQTGRLVSVALTASDPRARTAHQAQHETSSEVPHIAPRDVKTAAASGLVPREPRSDNSRS